jgi:hypothetical protein
MRVSWVLFLLESFPFFSPLGRIFFHANGSRFEGNHVAFYVKNISEPVSSSSVVTVMNDESGSRCEQDHCCCKPVKDLCIIC